MFLEFIGSGIVGLVGDMEGDGPYKGSGVKVWFGLDYWERWGVVMVRRLSKL
jgi:hypothetical protein